MTKAANETVENKYGPVNIEFNKELRNGAE